MELSVISVGIRDSVRPTTRYIRLRRRLRVSMSERGWFGCVTTEGWTDYVEVTVRPR